MTSRTAMMNTIFFKTLLVGLFISQTALAVDIKQIRARNEVAEQGLMAIRIEQAKAILAGTDLKLSWHEKITQLNYQISNINTYATGQANNNYDLSVDTSQKLIKELANKYAKKVYGDRSRDNVRQDPILANFMSSFRVLKQMEKSPEQHVELYSALQKNMTEIDVLIQNK